MIECENAKIKYIQNEKAQYCNIQAIYYQRFNCNEKLKHFILLSCKTLFFHKVYVI
jgi:hypothetical protein